MKKMMVLTAFTLGLLINTLKAQKGNYINVETGLGYGGLSGKIKKQMTADGFGDRDELILIGMDFGGKFPRKRIEGGNFSIRYGRALSKQHYIEIEGGVMHDVAVTGFDKFGSSSIVLIGGSHGNYLSFKNKTYGFSANYIFTNKDQNAGIGFGPALIFNQLKRSFSSENNKNYNYSKNYTLPGASFTCYWNFVNAKWLTCGLRNNLFFYAPANIEAVSYTNAPGNKSHFRGTKAGGVSGNINLSLGVKFR